MTAKIKMPEKKLATSYQFNYCYYHGHVDKGGEFVEDELEGGKAQYHQTYYPRAVTFDVQSGEVSTLAVKDKNAKLV